MIYSEFLYTDTELKELLQFYEDFKRQYPDIIKDIVVKTISKNNNQVQLFTELPDGQLLVGKEYGYFRYNLNENKRRNRAASAEENPGLQ